jgi:hypothetical protein
MSVTARAQTVQRPWQAVADEVVRREIGFDQIAYGGKTPLDELRTRLRKARRRMWMYKSVFRTSAAPHPFPQYVSSAANDDRPTVTRDWRRRYELKFGPRSLLALLALGGAIHFLAPSLTEAAARGLFASIPSGAVETIDQAQQCVQARPILDARNVLAGISTVSGCATERPFLSSPVSAQAAAQMYYAWRAVEGDYHISPSTILGLNIKGWIRATLQRFNPFQAVRTGGSSPIETALKNLSGRPGQVGLFQKLRNGYYVLVYAAHRLGSDSARDRFVTEAIPCVLGAAGSGFGYQLAGNLCPLVLYGKTADQIGWEERCLWSSSARRQFRITGPSTPTAALEEAAGIKSYIQARAVTCIARIGHELGWSENDIQVRQARVATIPVFTGISPAGEKERGGAPNLQASLPGLVFAIGDELKLTPSRRIDEVIRLNTTVAENLRAQEMVMAAARRAEPRLTSGLCLSNCADGGIQADVAAVLAEIRGDRLAIVQGVTNEHFLLTGPVKEQNGRYERQPTNRSVGSTNKPWLVVKLVAEGHDTLCNHFPVGASHPVDETSGADQDCTDGEGIVNLRLATARSMNAAFADAVHKIGIEAAKTYFRDLGFDFDPTLDGAHFIDGLVLGWGVTAAPMTQMRDLAALYRGYLGQEPAAHLPSIIDGADAQGRFDWRDLGISLDTLKRAGAILAAPIQDSSGTLHSLDAVLRQHGCTAPIGKTGTSDSAIPTEVRDKIMVAGFRCKGRQYVAYALIGSPRIDVPLGKIKASDLAELVAALLSAQGL